MKIKKILICTLTVFSLTICCFPSTASASSPVKCDISANSEVSPMSISYVWRYKVENNKLYKRLYNVTDKRWVGDWIYVGDC